MIHFCNASELVFKMITLRCAPRYGRLLVRQQYFDAGGLFISLLLSAPLLLDAVVIVVSARLPPLPPPLPRLLLLPGSDIVYLNSLQSNVPRIVSPYPTTVQNFMYCLL